MFRSSGEVVAKPRLDILSIQASQASKTLWHKRSLLVRKPSPQRIAAASRRSRSLTASGQGALPDRPRTRFRCVLLGNS